MSLKLAAFGSEHIDTLTQHGIPCRRKSFRFFRGRQSAVARIW